MAKHYRKMIVHGDHVNSGDSGPPWTVLWDTTARVDGRWSAVHVPSEAGAFERAAHFVKLGFVVHAIMDPTEAVVVDAEGIIARFAPPREAPPRVNPDRVARSAEQSARDILRGFGEDFPAAPGRTLAAATLHALFAPHGVSATEFEGAVSYAQGQGWLSVGDGGLTLTQAGYQVATS